MVSIEEVRPHEITCSKMDSIAQALKMFKLDNASNPSKKEGLEALVVNPNSKKYPNYSSSSYMRELPHDFFKKPFIYIHYKTDKGDNFQLISFGADGKYGGEGENEDIVYPTCHK
jgi:general secretion pathway protein G